MTMNKTQALMAIYERIKANGDARQAEARKPVTEDQYRRLAALPPTDEVERQLRVEVSEAARDRAARRYEQCLLRDTIRALRPADCWCMGSGAGQLVRVIGGGVELRFCDCAEGQAAGEANRVKAAQERATMRQERADRAWANADVPRRFLDCRLATSPVRASLPALIARMEAAPRESWYLWSEGTGTGKTGTAAAYLWQMVYCGENEHGRPPSALFVKVPDLLSMLRATYNRSDGPREIDILDRYATVDVLVLDELGAERAKDQEWLEDRLYQVIGRRHDDLRQTVITSNLSIEQVSKRIGERLAWRIVEMCGPGNIVQFRGSNLRDVKAQAEPGLWERVREMERGTSKGRPIQSI